MNYGVSSFNSVVLQVINILLVDDHELVRAGIRSLLLEAGYQVVAEGSGGRAEALLLKRTETGAAPLALTCWRTPTSMLDVVSEAGVMLTSHLTADAQADAVLYQSSLLGVDDTEVLG